MVRTEITLWDLQNENLITLFLNFSFKLAK